MGFLDKAKAAANDLAAKADTALGNAGLGTSNAAGNGGDADRYFRELGVLSYREASGHTVDPIERQRVITALQDLEARGGLRPTAAHAAPPPAPGVARAPGQTDFPPPPGPASPPPPPPGSATQPPPPPSWMSKE